MLLPMMFLLFVVMAPLVDAFSTTTTANIGGSSSTSARSTVMVKSWNMNFGRSMSTRSNANDLIYNRQKNNHHHHRSSTCTTTTALNQFKVAGMWNNGLSFGKGPFRFYKNFDSWMSPFPEQDRELYPEIFQFPKGVYEVSMVKPLGIIFEEIDIGKGVYVKDLVEGGNAERMGTVQKGDVLIGVTAVKVIGAKWERRLIPAKDLSFDTVVGAIGSNDEKWGCEDVILWFMKPEEVEDIEKVDDFLAFFNPPGDSAWRTA